MRRRIAALTCRLVGHRDPIWRSGYLPSGEFARVEGCPRCGALTGRAEFGSRQERRARRRRQPA